MEAVRTVDGDSRAHLRHSMWTSGALYVRSDGVSSRTSSACCGAQSWRTAAFQSRAAAVGQKQTLPVDVMAYRDLGCCGSSVEHGTNGFIELRFLYLSMRLHPAAIDDHLALRWVQHRR
jgi:hypothetical protein